MVVKHCPDCDKTLAVAYKTCPGCGYVFQAKKPPSTRSSEKKETILEDRLRPERNKKEAHRVAEFVYHGIVKVPTSTELKRTNQGNHTVTGQVAANTESNNLDDIETTQQEEKMNNDPNKVEGKDQQAPPENPKSTPPVKKRGRPKGSKDKQKRLPKGYKQLKLVRNFEGTETEWAIKDRNLLSQNDSNASSSAEDKDSRSFRKRGRPRGSKNKPSLSPLFYAEDYDDFYSDEKDDACNQTEEGFYIPADKKEKFSLILDDINHRILGQTFRV